MPELEGASQDGAGALEGDVDNANTNPEQKQGEEQQQVPGEKEPAPPYVVVRGKAGWRPVYDLGRLVGEEGVRELRRRGGVWEGEVVGVREGKRTGGVLGGLWGMVGFLGGGGGERGA